MTTRAGGPGNTVVLQEVDTPTGKPRVLRAGGLRFELEGDDTLSGGVGGWEQVPRPRRRPTTEWTGQPLFELTLPLLLTGMRETGTDRSIEREIAELIALGTLPDGRSQPPSVIVSGPVRVPKPGMRWVLQGLEWGEQIRDDAGQRVQQQVTVSLLEGVGVQVLVSPAARAQTRAPVKAATAAAKPAARPARKR